MADKTPGDGVLSGFIIPWAFSATHANDHARETDYTDGDRRPVRAAIPADQSLILEPSGDAESGAPASYFVRFPKRAGVAKPGGARPVYATTTGGTFYGADRPTLITGWAHVHAGISNGSDMVVLDDGTIVLAFWVTSGANTLYKVDIRDTAGAWGVPATVVTSPRASEAYAGVSIVLADDGNLLLYYVDRISTTTATVAATRSTDGGTTWVQQTDNALEAISANGGLLPDPDVRRMRAVNLNGTIALFVDYYDGSDAKVAQYTSTDGGLSFALVDTLADNTLGDVEVSGRYLVVSTVIESSNVMTIRRTGSASMSAWDDAGVTFGTVNSTTDRQGHAMASEDDGTLYLYFHTGTNHQWSAIRSKDYGKTWTTTGSEQIVYFGTTLTVGDPAIVNWRGQFVCVCGEIDTSAAPGTTAAVTHEIRLGGQSSLTVTQEYQAWAVSNWVVAPEFGATWLPFALLNDDWNTNNGTATWSVGSTGARIVAVNPNFGENIKNFGGVGTQTGGGIFFAVVEEDSTHLDGYITVHAAMGDGVAGSGYRFDVSSTHYHFRGQASANSFTSTHGITGRVAVIIAINLTAQSARAWYAAADVSGPLTWTSAGTATDTTNTTNVDFGIRSVGQAGTSDSHIYVLGGAYSDAIIPAMASGFTNPDDLDGIPLGTTRPAWLDKGITLRSTGGVAYGSTSEYEIPIKGKRPKEYTLPSVSPSPYRGWRSGGTAAVPLAATQTLKYTFDTDNEAAMRVGSDVVAIYLGGLYGVSEVTIKDNGSMIGTVSLATTFTATRVGNSVYPVESGADSEGVYVLYGEFADTIMELGAAGARRKVVSNTAGTLEEGATIGTSRAVFELDGVDDGADPTSFTASIHPRECVIFIYGRVTWTRLDVLITATEPVPPEGYREVGVVAAGPVAICGYKNDRSSRTEWEDGANMITERDGSRRATEWAKPRRMVEASWIGSHRDVKQIREASTTAPDYIVADVGGSPAALRDDVTLLIPEVYKAINGKATPVVWLPYLPTSSSATEVLKTGHAGGSIYGRIVSGVRQERAGNVGVINVSDAYSVSTLTIEEEI